MALAAGATDARETIAAQVASARLSMPKLVP